MFGIRRIRGAYRWAGLTVALALAALAAVPAIASAASAAGVVSTPTSSTILYTGSSSGDNVTVDDPSVTVYTFAEEGITETSTSCTLNTAPNPDVVTCTHATDWTAVTLTMNAGNDAVNASAVANDGLTINGGDDNDNITGTGANDTINAGDGNDTINGSNGNDRLIGEAGSDTFNGDAGIDRVLYSIGCSESPPSITITIDGTANDAGCNGESADNVTTTVESVTGSTGNDTITGSCFANTFAGDPGSANGDAGGNDTLSGDPNTGCTAASGSTDFFGGGEGNDSFNGDGTIDGTHFAGFDTVTYGSPYTGSLGISVDLDDVADDNDGFGNTGDNVNGDIERVIGNSGADTINATAADQAVSLFGRLGNDTLTDSPFGDFLNGEGGADTINCTNGGTDSYVIDGSDTVNGSCEIGT